MGCVAFQRLLALLGLQNTLEEEKLTDTRAVLRPSQRQREELCTLGEGSERGVGVALLLNLRERPFRCINPDCKT